MKEAKVNLENQIKEVEKLTDIELKGRIKSMRSDALPGLLPTLIERWHKTTNTDLSTELNQFFLDTKKQEELPYFMRAIQNPDYADLKSELISVLWQSSLDASEHFEDLIEIALSGDYMVIIEIGTVIDAFETEFDEDLIMNTMYQIEEHIESEEDVERRKLLGNLRQIVSELPLI